MEGSHGRVEVATASVASIKSASQPVLRSVLGKPDRLISASYTRRKREPGTHVKKENTPCRNDFGHCFVPRQRGRAILTCIDNPGLRACGMNL
jgi:hypothetical protein